MKKIVALVLSVVVVVFIFNEKAFSGENRPPAPRNIILFIGDGMGVAAITAAKVVKGELAMEKLPVAGLVMTCAEKDQLITDSAAAATALATGYKTANARISVRLDTTNSHLKVDTLKTVLEWAGEYGLATGLVATSSITHATPACFGAHVEWRSNQTEIARQLTSKNIQVLLGGGRRFFLPGTDTDSVRADSLDLFEVLKDKGYAIVNSGKELAEIDAKKSGKVVGLFSDAGMPDIPKRSPSLPEMTRKALDILERDPDGFFLMVEGSQIDWKAHDNNAEGMIAETIEFDDAVGVGIEFSKKHPDTLLLVTADHETGGASIVGGSLVENNVAISFSTHGHTAVMVGVLASGPGAENFGGIIDNTLIGKELIEYVRNRSKK